MNTISARLKKLREDKNLHSKKLCEELGFNTSTYSKLENGKKSIDLYELRKLSKYYSVTADYILGMEKDQKDLVAYMKTDKNLCEEDINEIQFVLSVMDDANVLKKMKKNLER